eukprot:6455028-Amphidinium_carterae.1
MQTTSRTITSTKPRLSGALLSSDLSIHIITSNSLTVLALSFCLSGCLSAWSATHVSDAVDTSYHETTTGKNKSLHQPVVRNASSTHCCKAL